MPNTEAVMDVSLLFALLVQHAPPGQTAFSVEVAEDCVKKATCEGARWSDFYSTWTRKESAEHGAKRYEGIAAALIDSARETLCRAADDSALADCVPAKGAIDPQSKRARWDVTTLSVAGAAIAMLESGYREDVQVGRGSARKPSTDGGRGRGPGGEGCLIQAHPHSAWRFSDAPAELKKKAEKGDRTARNLIVESLLGSDQESLKRCWRTGLRMLIHARAYCAWAAPETDWDFATYSMYGTGTSCTSPNDGKTAMRTRLFRTILTEAKARAAKPGKKRS
jgi:hypothetical protein